MRRSYTVRALASSWAVGLGEDLALAVVEMVTGEVLSKIFENDEVDSSGLALSVKLELGSRMEVLH